MKIERLTDNKIRIILNIDDLAKKNIDIYSLIKNNTMSQKLFKKILTEAKKEVGFDPQDARILIEAFISSEGLFILTFTKIAEDIIQNNISSLKPKDKTKNSNNQSDTAIYEFFSFSDFENFCTYINDTNLNGFAKRISLYEYQDKFFLVFSGIDKTYNNKFLDASISEFAKLASNTSVFESKLVEYGKTIFKTNAIKNGIKYFSNA